MTEKTSSRAALDFLRDHWKRVLLSVVLLAIFFGNSGFRSLVRNYIELRRLRLEMLSLEREEKRTEALLIDAKSGNHTVERYARRELGYIGNGEIEYRFPPPPASENR